MTEKPSLCFSELKFSSSRLNIAGICIFLNHSSSAKMFHLTILILLSCLRSVAQALLLHIHELYASARNQRCVCLQLAPWIRWSLRRRYLKKEKETFSCRPPSPQLMLSPHLVYFQLSEKYAAWAALSFHNEQFSSKTPPCSLSETWVLVTPHTPSGLDSGLRITSDLCFTSSHYRYYETFWKFETKVERN